MARSLSAGPWPTNREDPTPIDPDHETKVAAWVAEVARCECAAWDEHMLPRPHGRPRVLWIARCMMPRPIHEHRERSARPRSAGRHPARKDKARK